MKKKHPRPPRHPICAVSFGLGIGVAEALLMLIFAWSGWLYGYGESMSEELANIFYGYGPTFTGGLAGAFWGLLDGFIFGFVVAFVYNFCIKKRK